MDLQTSRRPQPIPGLRSELPRGKSLEDQLAAGHLDDLGFHQRCPLDPLEQRVIKALAEVDTIYPDALVALVAAPRIAIHGAIVRLARLKLLATPRVLSERSVAMCSPFEALLDIEPEGLDDALYDGPRAALEAIVAASPEAFAKALVALPRPLIGALERREATFRDSERFLTRTAFGLPEAPQADQGERLRALFLRVRTALDGQPEAPILEGLLEGRLRPLTASERADLAALADTLTARHLITLEALMSWTLRAVLTALFGRPHALAHVHDADLSELFLHDLGALLQLEAPHPQPAWLPVREARPATRIAPRLW
jgi:hypothetical protein